VLGGVVLAPELREVCGEELLQFEDFFEDVLEVVGGADLLYSFHCFF